MSLASDIAARIAKRRKVHVVQTDEGPVYIRGMNGTERNEYLSRGISEENSNEEKLILDQRLIASQMCNEDGSAAFASDEEGLAVILQWDIPTYVEPVVKAILRASGIGAKEQEDETKK